MHFLLGGLILLIWSWLSCIPTSFKVIARRRPYLNKTTHVAQSLRLPSAASTLIQPPTQLEFIWVVSNISSAWTMDLQIKSFCLHAWRKTWYIKSSSRPFSPSCVCCHSCLTRVSPPSICQDFLTPFLPWISQMSLWNHVSCLAQQFPLAMLYKFFPSSDELP